MGLMVALAPREYHDPPRTPTRPLPLSSYTIERASGNFTPTLKHCRTVRGTPLVFHSLVF